ncbi:hypothetical protein [Fenollaria massiliensis]|uniref:hypothetical protein n=1 Tax=Fenollaria massiliensis TaxID=938288 RepID=UPI00036BC421|nr:hypothetical protein [Fenollaria massiliensis]
MLKAIAFTLIFLGTSLQLPSKIASYKKERNAENLLEMLAYILIPIGSFLLAFGYFFG